MLEINLEVKFRAAGITFGELRKKWKIPGSFKAVGANPTLVAFEDRGVTLTVRIVQ